MLENHTGTVARIQQPPKPLRSSKQWFLLQMSIGAVQGLLQSCSRILQKLLPQGSDDVSEPAGAAVMQLDHLFELVVFSVMLCCWRVLTCAMLAASWPLYNSMYL